MSMGLRLALAAVLISVLGGLILVMGQGPGAGLEGEQDEGAEAGMASTIDARGCQECHPAIYEQWYGSQHRLAYLNPDVVELSDNHQQTNCIPCHAPRPVFELGVDAQPRSRMAHRDQGVSCLTCHLIPSAASRDRTPRLAGTRDIPAGSCAFEVVLTPVLGTPEFCAGCHNQHETTDQWRATVYGRPGPEYQTCLDCHMPTSVFSPTVGVEPRPSVDHTSPGSHDTAYIRSALDFEAGLAGEAVEVSITNARAGHHFPTEERSRAVDLWLQFLDAEGAALGDEIKLYRFRDPYRGEPNVERTLLPHGETLTVRKPRAEWPAGAKRAVVRLVYMRRPYPPVPETHRYELFRQEIELP